MKILFSDEQMFDIDGVYNSQNERIWAANRVEADTKGGITRRRKYPQKVMVQLAVCSQGVSPLIIFEDGTLACSLHKRSASGCSSVWKQSLRELLDVSTRRWEASYPCENAIMVCREFSCIYRQRPMSCQQPGFELVRLLNTERGCISNQLEENYIEKHTNL